MGNELLPKELQDRLLELNELVEKLDTLDAEKSFGEIIVRLIESNLTISYGLNHLVESMDKSSHETTKINKWIMYLTVAIALSSIVIIIRELSLLF